MILTREETLRLERIPQWCEEAEKGLSEATYGDQKLIAQEVNAGRSQLYRMGDTWVVVFVETSTLIIACLQGSRAMKVLDILSGLAQSRGLLHVKFFTKRAGLIKASQKFGFTEEFVVMRASVQDIREGIENASFSKTLQQVPDCESRTVERSGIKPYISRSGNC